MKNNCNCKQNVCEKNTITTDKYCNLVISDNTFNYNYVLIFILYLNTTSGQETIGTVTRENRDLKISFNTTKDGFYTILKVIVPLDETKPYYYKDGYFYHNILQVELEDILKLNTRISEVLIDYLYYFSICNLKKCFVNICQEIFKTTSSICNRSEAKDLIYKRDLLWSAINVITYLAEMDLFEEAQRLLEEFSSCNGLCSSEYSNDCGCNG